MNDFERKIQDLPWREPSDELKNKIFEATPEARAVETSRPASTGGKVSINWSIALATAAGFVGFLAGTVLTANNNMEQAFAGARTDIRIVETSSSQNSFDFSGGAIQILPGEFTAYIDDEAETVQ